MFSYLFTFRGLTAAQTARDVLRGAGIFARLQRAPGEISGLGCTWALHVAAGDGLRAADTLRAYSCAVSGSYRRQANGYLERAEL